MSKLEQLQTDFQSCMMNEDNATFKKYIIDDAKIGAEKRLSIYADAYRLRIIEALATTYPKLHLLLGDDLFDTTARQYINQYPSEYRNMRWVGDCMCDHLLKALPQHPIAAELAAFEWALGIAFDAQDAPVIAVQDLAAILPEAWSELGFALHPSVQLLDLKWNVMLVWQALDAQQTPPASELNNAPCIIWRSDLNSHYRSLKAQEFQAIQQIKAGASFGELCESLFEKMGERATEQAAQYLASWLEAGIISHIRTS